MSTIHSVSIGANKAHHVVEFINEVREGWKLRLAAFEARRAILKRAIQGDQDSSKKPATARKGGHEWIA